MSIIIIVVVVIVIIVVVVIIIIIIIIIIFVIIVIIMIGNSRDSIAEVPKVSIRFVRLVYCLYFRTRKEETNIN